MRKFIAMIAAVLIVLSSATAAFADNGNVTYDGKSKEFIFAPGSSYSPTDLFPDFKGVMPGDSITQKITVKNDASNEVKVKIYIRSLGAHQESAAFLSQLKLRVKTSADNDMAYMFNAAASETAQLTDWVCLGTLYSGGTVNLDVILDVPVELDNQFQNQAGYLDWEFMIEEFPIDPDDPKPPQTGDNSQIGLWIGVLVVSMAMMLILIFWRKKKEDAEENKN